MELRAVGDGSADCRGSRVSDPIRLDFDPRWPIGLDRPAAHVPQFAWGRPDGNDLALCRRRLPCGHAKKLYGNENNDPRWVRSGFARADGLTPSVSHHDVIVASAVPMYWEDPRRRSGGSVAAARSVARADSRAIERTASWLPGADRRGRARGDVPAVVPGESDQVRYAVSLERRRSDARQGGGAASRPGAAASPCTTRVIDPCGDRIRAPAGRLGWNRDGGARGPPVP